MERNQPGFIAISTWSTSQHATLPPGDPVPNDTANLAQYITCQVKLDAGTYNPLDAVANGGAGDIINPTPGPTGTNLWTFPILIGEQNAVQSHFAPVVEQTLEGIGVQAMIDYEASNTAQTEALGGARVESLAGSTNAVLLLSRAVRGMGTFNVVSTDAGPPQTIRATPELGLVAPTVTDFYLVNGKPRLLSFTDETYLAEITGSSEVSGDVVFTIGPIDASLMPSAGDKLVVK